MLDIGKLKKKYKEDRLSEYVGLNNQIGLELFLTKSTLTRLLFDLNKYVVFDSGCWSFIFNDKLNAVLHIILSDYKSNKNIYR